jgi:MYXO-CTERM domain-containing protein
MLRRMNRLTLLALLCFPSAAFASNVLTVLRVQVDRPTVTTLGLQALIADDDNFNASIAVRYRVAGAPAWTDGAPLHRVHPELVVGRTVAPQFAGSIFDLRPGTSYEVEVHATDPDGPVDQVLTLPIQTRPVPSDPVAPRAVPVTDAPSLTAALAAAQPGDVITLAAGTYPGTYAITTSGSRRDPIVIRGANRDGVIIDGQACTGCNLLEVYGSDVHIEQLTLRNGERAIRFQGAGASDNVVRRVHISNVTLGIGGKPDQTDFYICDNVVEGRISWPLTYGDDGAAHASDDGIVVNGSGHVVCHNQIQGFADALQNYQVGARANDFYGNDVRFTYDDGVELDGAEGNIRAFRNRFLNTYDTLSFQPIYGGPAYAFRNVIINVVNEEFKLHALGGTPSQPPVGVLIQHNTIVRAGHALQLSTPDAVHNYVFENNLLLGNPTDGVVVQWDTPIDVATGRIDWNGYAPDGAFEFGYGPTGQTYAGFAQLQAGQRQEAHGTLLTGAVFASGLVAPTGRTPLLGPQDVALAAGSPARDRGTPIPGISDHFMGAAPDLGAEEAGCAQPIYGVRPDGVDERNAPLGCIASGSTSSSSGSSGSSSGAGSSSGGSTSGSGSTSSGSGSASGRTSAGGSGSPTVKGCGCGSDGGGWLLALGVIAATGLRRARRRTPRTG